MSFDGEGEHSRAHDGGDDLGKSAHRRRYTIQLSAPIRPRSVIKSQRQTHQELAGENDARRRRRVGGRNVGGGQCNRSEHIQGNKPAMCAL